MRVRVRAAAAVVLVVLGLLGLVWVFRGGSLPSAVPPAGTPPASPAPPAPSPAGAVPSLPPLALEEGRITGADASGRLQWELRAAALETDAARQEVRLQRVGGKFYERGSVVVTFTAPRAVFSSKTQDVTLSGGVRAQAPGGRTLRAERLQWLAARRLLVATGNVRLAQHGMTVHADRLESDISLRKTRLTGNIRVTIRE